MNKIYPPLPVKESEYQALTGLCAQLEELFSDDITVRECLEIKILDDDLARHINYLLERATDLVPAQWTRSDPPPVSAQPEPDETHSGELAALAADWQLQLPPEPPIHPGFPTVLIPAEKTTPRPTLSSPVAAAIPCQVCGALFTTKRSDTKYCSAGCRGKAYRQSPPPAAQPVQIYNWRRADGHEFNEIHHLLEKSKFQPGEIITHRQNGQFRVALAHDGRQTLVHIG